MKFIVAMLDNLSFYIHCSNLAQAGEYEIVKELIQERRVA
jgi:hypothetical protein